MDLKSAEANMTTLAENSSKSALRYVYTWVATKPRTGTLIALGLVAAAFIGGMVVGGSF